MSRYFSKEHLSWEQAPVRGGTVMDKSVVWEGDYDIRSAFFRMPKGMNIPRHTHPQWVQVICIERRGQLEDIWDQRHEELLSYKEILTPLFGEFVEENCQ